MDRAENEEQRIAAYTDKLDPKKASLEDFKQALSEAIGDRALALYFVQQVLEDEYPEVDSREVLAEACTRFGEYKGKQFTGIETAADFLKALTSMGGKLAWEQDIVALGDDYAEKAFHTCPHVDSLRQVGLSDEQIKVFCNSILMNADYGMVRRFEDLEMKFPHVIGSGDATCNMCITRKTWADA